MFDDFDLMETCEEYYEEEYDYEEEEGWAKAHFFFYAKTGVRIVKLQAGRPNVH